MPVPAAIRIPTKPLREEYFRQIQHGRSGSEIARAAGFIYWSSPEGRFKADLARMKRALGILPERNKTQHRNRYVFPRTAERLMKALDLDPVDIGL